MRHLKSTTRKEVLAILSLSVTLSLFADLATAGITSVSGDVDLIAAPSSVEPQDFIDDHVTRVFLEKSNTLITANLNVDISAPGTVEETADLSPGMIPAGTHVNSYFFHFDPTSTFPFNPSSDPFSHSTGLVTFDTDILGVLVQTISLDATDGLLGAESTAYPVGSFRGFELPLVQFAAPNVRDVLSVSGDLRTLTFNLNSGPRVDQFRVITTVPEPSSSLLICTSVLATMGFSRRAKCFRQL